MKKLLIITLLTISTAHAAVKCRAISDWNYVAVFPGYVCPAGYFYVGPAG